MAKGRKKEDKPLYRAVRFEVFPAPEEVALLFRVSENLRYVWNTALRDRQKSFEDFLKPIYEKIGQEKKRAQEAGFFDLWKDEICKDFNRLLRERDIPVNFISNKKSLLLELREVFKQHTITLYDQINELTQKRKDGEFGSVPRNWQEETLDSLDGSFKSFLALRKNGDVDAKPPRARADENGFYKIPGRYGFKVYEGKFQLSFGKLGQTLTFPIPEFQQERLAAAVKLKKFELYRDERNMAKAGRFWISIAYEIPKPVSLPLGNNVVFLSIGASRLGVVSSFGEFCFNLPRPDYHWKPAINVLDERIAKTVKGSRKWKKRIAARARMFAKLGHQQKQHGQYEVIQRLLQYGVHFVVTELQVRSKQGALADASDPTRGNSPFGANWSAQNTGNIGRFLQKLTDKAVENGGTVIKRKAPALSLQERSLTDDQRKILIARKLRDEFLAEK